MKFWSNFLIAVSLLIGGSAHADSIRLAVTTSFQNSGLSDVLLPQIKADIDLDVQMVVVGTGQALKLGEAGDVDAILVHSRKAEDAFLTSGFGSHRREIMYNDFVFIGPSDDPAGIEGAKSAREVLQKIAIAKAPFVSRGDDSGTHKKELSLWESAGMAGADLDGKWYRAAGSGMGASLNTASGMNAYIMADRASWLNFGNKGELTVLFSGDPVLFNQYAFIPVSQTRHAHVKSDLVMRLEIWLTGETAEGLISGYEINGEKLFTFNATPTQ